MVRAATRALRSTDTVRLVALALTAGSLAFAGCGGATPKARSAAKSVKSSKSGPPPRYVTPARLFALPQGSGVTTNAVDPDGTRRLIVHGIRVVQRVDGSLERAKEVFPGGRSVSFVELPDRLGGGYVFYTNASGTALIWRAKTWAGQLEPMANVDLDVEQIVPGFDRLYVVDRRSVDVVALDSETGKPTDLGSLPVAPAYSDMAFADEWVGAVEVPYQGILATFDAGSSWRRIDVYPTYGVKLEGQGIIMSTGQGRLLLSPDGAVRQETVGAQGDALFSHAGRHGKAKNLNAQPPPPESTLPPPGPLGREPLVNAVLHGFPVDKQSAVVIHQGAIGRVSLSDGRLLDVDEHALVGAATCQGVPLGDSFGFVCGEERGRTTVYRFEAPMGLERVMRFDGPRYVASSGNGSLVIRGSCSEHDSDSGGSYCVVDRAGKSREIKVKGDVGVERVVALTDGRAAVVVPPRLGAPGLLTIVERSGAAKSVKLKLPKADASTLALLKKGLWLDGFVETKRKKDIFLSGWVVAAGPFVGVRVNLDGKVKIGKIENDIGQTLLSSTLALVLGRGGRAAETVDGGFTWREVDLPPSADERARRQVGASSEIRGCGPLGCAFGSWLRVGWSGKKEKAELVMAEAPRPTVLPSPGGGRWRMECVPTGAGYGPPAGTKRPPPRPTYRYRAHRPDEMDEAPWASFFGVAPPAKKAEDVGLDYGLEHTQTKLRGYAWGTRGASWDRVGNWQVRAFDEWSLADAVWSTAVSRTPWADQISATQAFGLDPSAPTAWSAAFEPSGRGAALLVNARGTMELYLLEENRTIVPVSGAAKNGLYQLSGAVKLGSTWYLGSAQGNNAFQLFRVEGNRLVRVRMYPLRDASRARGMLHSELTRNQRGDALAIWVQARRTRGIATKWYVYPVNPESGDVSEPIELAGEELANTPEHCASGDDGYILEGEPPVDPYVDFAKGADSVRARRVTARMLASVRGVCLDALSAESEGGVPARMAGTDLGTWGRGRSTTEMVLQDRDRSGQRWGFRCAP